MQPFDGSAGQLTVTRAVDPHDPIQVTLGPGQVYIGARTHGFMTEDLNNVAITTPSDNRRIFGLRPGSAGQMFAGVEVAIGNNIGKVMIGGTLTGLVDIPGNVRLFYAGMILTGDATGTFNEATSSGIPNNFFIGGDIENLVSGTSFGTDTLTDATLEQVQFKTGFDLDVRGRIGQIKTLDTFLGAVTVENRSTSYGIAQEELEYSGPPLSPLSDESYFDPLFYVDQASLGTKTRNASYNNDSFDTAQWLGTLYSSDLGQSDSIQVRGFTYTQYGDGVDYYAFGMLAGQTAEIQLLNTASGIGVFDPDGRLIMTDYSNIGADRVNKPFRFTADRPGPYRIAIANRGDVNFNGIADGTAPTGEALVILNPDPYELRIQRVGNIALGGLIAERHIATLDFGSDGITILDGDLGSVRAGTFGAGTIFSESNPWSIQNGNLRSMEAISMGVIRSTNGAITIPSPPSGVGVALGPDFLVPKGSVGLIRAYGADPTSTMLRVNDDLATPQQDITRISPSLATGLDIQLVDGPLTNVFGNFLANRAIGSIRAFNLGNFFIDAPVIAVNVDHKGDDGRIDLIDVTNSFGSLQTGGPAIATGPNGNVRYIHVNTPDAGGDGITDVRDLLVFTDRFFGGGQPQQTIGQPGEVVKLTDDNGTAVNLTPIPLVLNTDPTTGLPISGFNNPGFLRVLTYPIRDKAGVVIINVTAYPAPAAPDAACRSPAARAAVAAASRSARLRSAAPAPLKPSTPSRARLPPQPPDRIPTCCSAENPWLTSSASRSGSPIQMSPAAARASSTRRPARSSTRWLRTSAISKPRRSDWPGNPLPPPSMPSTSRAADTPSTSSAI